MERRLVFVEKRVAKHDEDLYEGRGSANPSITTRLDLMETTYKAIRFYGRWVVLLVGGILVTAVVGLLIKR